MRIFRLVDTPTADYNHLISRRYSFLCVRNQSHCLSLEIIAQNAQTRNFGSKAELLLFRVWLELRKRTLPLLFSFNQPEVMELSSNCSSNAHRNANASGDPVMIINFVLTTIQMQKRRCAGAARRPACLLTEIFLVSRAAKPFSTEIECKQTLRRRTMTETNKKKTIRKRKSVATFVPRTQESCSVDWKIGRKERPRNQSN